MDALQESVLDLLLSNVLLMSWAIGKVYYQCKHEITRSMCMLKSETLDQNGK